MKRSYFITGIVILLLFAGGLFSWQRNVKAPTSTPLPTPVTSKIPNDWKTYTNTKYHYSFRYPREYYIYQLAGIGVPEEVTRDSDLILIRKDKVQEALLSIHGTNLNSLDPEDIKLQFGATNLTDVRLIDTIIAGQLAYNLEFRKDDKWEKSDFYYTKSIGGPVIGINLSINNLIANQILSSLEFTQ